MAFPLSAALILSPAALIFYPASLVLSSAAVVMSSVGILSLQAGSSVGILSLHQKLTWKFGSNMCNKKLR